MASRRASVLRTTFEGAGAPLSIFRKKKLQGVRLFSRPCAIWSGCVFRLLSGR